jgi:hypothetical protein
MPFADPIVAGTELVRDAIQSPDYVPGVSGWTVNADGTAEFRAVTAEGFLLLSDGQVTEAKLADGAVTENKIAVDAVTGAKIAGAAVDATKLADGSVDASKIIDGAVVAGKIAADAVGATEIAANAIVAGKIAAGAIDTMALNANTIVGAAISGTTMTVAGDTAVVRAVDAGGVAVASLNSDGLGSFAALSVASNDVEIDGKQLSATLAGQAASILAYGIDTSRTGNTTTESGVFEVAFVAPTSKYYQVAISAWLAGPAGADAFISLRDGGAASPTTSSTRVMWAGHGLAVAGTGEQFGAYAPVYFAAGQHRLLLSYGRYAGTAGTVYYTSGVTQPGLIQIMDTPAGLANLAVTNTGGGSGGGAVQTYSTTWQATWSRTYEANNSWASYLGATCYQGSYDGTSGNNRKSMIGFDWASIMGALSGATILGCGLRLYAQHWYWNAGGTAIIGSHGSGVAPATYGGANPNRLQSGSWPNPGLRWVDLMPSGLPSEFKSGATKGIVLGPGPSSSVDYYGYFAGAGQDYDPQINFVYQK